MSLCLSPLILQSPFAETGTADRYGNDMVWTADIFPGGGTTRSSPAPHLTIALDSLHSLFIDHNGGGTAAGGTIGFKNGNGFEKVFTVATLVNKVSASCHFVSSIFGETYSPQPSCLLVF